MITRKDIAAHLERGVRTGFLVGSRGYTSMRSGFAAEVVSDGAFEEYADMGAPPWPTQNAGKAGAAGTDGRTGAPQTNEMNAGGPIKIMGGNEQPQIVYNLDWEIAIGITHNAIDDDRAGDLEAWARGAAVNFERHKDYECFRALNSGGATTAFGAGPDGLSFFNDSHIEPGAAYQTAQDNSYALALSFDNFKTVRIAASKFLDGRGQPIGFNHNLLIVPPDLEYEAAQITRNPQEFGIADRNINPYSGTIRAMVAPGGWLDTTAWFLVETGLPQKPLKLQLRKNPELVIWDDEFVGDGGVRYYKWHARYAVSYNDWRLAIQGNT